MATVRPDLVDVDVSFVASLASAGGALFILVNCLCCRAAHRLFVLRLISFLAVANLLSALAYMMSFIEWRVLGHVSTEFSGGWCLTQAVLMVVFEASSILWTVLIAFALHQQIVGRRLGLERREIVYHFVGWGVPTALALVLLLSGQLGPADEPRVAWCWISSNAGPRHANHTTAGNGGGGGDGALHAGRGGAVPFLAGGGADSRWVQLVSFYAPLVAACVVNLCTYLRVGSAFRRMAREGVVDASKERMIQLRLRLYLLVFLLVWSAPLAHRAAQLAGYDPAWLRLLHTVTQCSMGWLNCLVYGCNEATASRPPHPASPIASASLLSPPHAAHSAYAPMLEPSRMLLARPAPASAHDLMCSLPYVTCACATCTCVGCVSSRWQLKPYRERFASLSCSLFGLQLHRLRRSTRHSFSAAAVLGGASGSTSGGAGIGPNEWRVDRSRLVCADSLGGSQHMGGSLDACSGIDTQQQSASASANATSGTGAAPVGAASGV